MRIFLASFFIFIATVSFAQTTIGVNKAIVLPDGNSGNFIRTGQVVFTFDPNSFADSAMIKVDLVLYKSLESFGGQLQPIPFKHEVQVYYKFSDPVIKDLINLLYDKIITKDTLFFNNSIRIQI